MEQWKNMCSSKWVMRALGVVALLLFIGVGLVFSSEIFGVLCGFRASFHKDWYMGILVFVAIFTLMACLMIPLSPIVVAAGFIYGVEFGIAIVLLSYIVASNVLLFLGRSIFSKTAKELMEHSELLTKIRSVLSDRHRGLELNVLLCFFPMPFGWHVILYAVTDFPAVTFVVSLLLGLMPATLLFVFSGRTIFKVGLAKGLRGLADTEMTMLLVGIAVAGIVIAYLAYLVRKTVEEIEEAPTPTAPNPTESDPLLRGSTAPTAPTATAGTVEEAV